MNSTPVVWLLLAQLAGVPVQPDSMRLKAQSAPPVVSVRDQSRDQIRFDESRFDSVTANTLRGLFEDAQQMGLPTKPLIDRALEGAARRISSDRIVRAVRELAAALTSARSALGPSSTVDELTAGAEALRIGFDEATLQAVRQSRPPGTAATALVVLTDIAGRGVPRPNARDAVTSLSRLPQSDDALQGLQALVAKNAQRGPGMALDALNRYVRSTIPAGVSPSTPATTERKPVRPPDP